MSQILTEKTGHNWFCHNYGINGNTSSDLYRRSWGCIKSNPDSKILILIIGTNDIKIPTPTNIFRDNVSKIVNQARCLGKEIIMSSIPNITLSPAYLSNKSHLIQYNEILKEISDENKTFFVRLNSLDQYLIDGVHFTNLGNVKIAEKFAEYILKL